MSDDLAFLHTARIHVDTFGVLMHELAPQLKVRHFVAEDLLETATNNGGLDLSLTEEIQETMREAALSGAKIVVCTCSTIGDAAERTETKGKFIATRIDRAMADAAVCCGSRILVVASVGTALQPTRQLLESSAQNADKNVNIEELLVPGAWPLFLKGADEAYTNTIASAIRSNGSVADVVVLAQASMAAAAAKCPDFSAPILSSPRLGVQAVISKLKELSGNG